MPVDPPYPHERVGVKPIIVDHVFAAGDALLEAADACPDGDPWAPTNAALQALHKAADAYREARAGNDGLRVDSPADEAQEAERAATECPCAGRATHWPWCPTLRPVPVPEQLPADLAAAEADAAADDGDQGVKSEDCPLVQVGWLQLRVARHLPVDAPPWAYAAQAYLRAGRSLADTMAMLGGHIAESDLVRWVLG